MRLFINIKKEASGVRRLILLRFKSDVKLFTDLSMINSSRFVIYLKLESFVCSLWNRTINRLNRTVVYLVIRVRHIIQNDIFGKRILIVSQIFYAFERKLGRLVRSVGSNLAQKFDLLVQMQYCKLAEYCVTTQNYIRYVTKKKFKSIPSNFLKFLPLLVNRCF